ncbi:hypothetical protein Riv7116_5931 [Rivularia sp. PCC 7116]|nr:hypothetical protein Riv7116_5931 [Rivularia sp. PCC 7116]
MVFLIELEECIVETRKLFSLPLSLSGIPTLQVNFMGQTTSGDRGSIAERHKQTYENYIFPVSQKALTKKGDKIYKSQERASYSSA